MKESEHSYDGRKCDGQRFIQHDPGTAQEAKHFNKQEMYLLLRAGSRRRLKCCGCPLLDTNITDLSQPLYCFPTVTPSRWLQHIEVYPDVRMKPRYED